MKENIYNIRLLRVFVAVVERKGFSAAQQDLNMSTPAISNYMSQLEMQLGMQLCNRGRSGFSLTSKGQLIFDEAKRLLSQIDGFENYVLELKGELRGAVTVGILDSMLTDKQVNIVDLLGNFASKHPKVHVNLKVLNPFELQREVLEGKIDLAIGSLPTRMSGLKYIELYVEQHWLYCSDRHELSKVTKLSPEIVRDNALLNRGYWSSAEAMRHGFKDCSATIDSMEAALILVLCGSYVGYLPDHLALQWEQQGRLFRLLPETFGYRAEFSLIMKNGRSREPLIQAFRDEMDKLYIKDIS
ncbi:LysR family transcriptional regulator [Pseudomonas nitroreducens]|uniref:LysR family transcriptional regulator n=1 Tax=Pseudomonas nitroreducens TaxID=46680 RepID=UPI001E456674|nr:MULTISPECIES: LysR family transcriptional regulator [Pseudomonas]MCE4069540.1 LysR family transcriptional regulator [Pseudomonas nitritireducens]MCE4079297.1 LysR family transcriptional regulator [Pseudomonas nitroreducens]